MKFNSINRLGDWNPQLLRELKGRLKPRNILLPIVISLLGQCLLLMSFQIQLPTRDLVYKGYDNKYCTGAVGYQYPKCLTDELDNVITNWQLWSQDIFTSLSLIACFTLLVAGSYLLINDLANEERRETLNFIRLSPQSPQSILSGKMLGVPILMYLVVFLAIPLHLWSGLSANIPLISILSFYTVILTTSLFYYSGALLFGLVGSWLSGFQAWLGSGVVLGFLLLTQKSTIPEMPDDNPLIILRLFNPYNLTPNSVLLDSSTFANFHWFALPLGASFFATVGFTLLINGLGTYCIWQSLQRCFRDANATMLSKQQSYLLTSVFTVITLGCANWQELVFKHSPRMQLISENVACLLLLYFGLFLYLIAALSPHRQTSQDWARYRKMYSSQQLGDGKLFKDLIWGEKSPGLLAIAINAMIVITSLIIFISLPNLGIDHKIYAFYALAIAGSLVMLYAALVQLTLLMKNQHRVFWSVGIVGAVIVLPVIIGAMFYSYSSHNSFLWLFTIAAPILVISPEGKSLSAITLFIAILSHWSLLGLLIFQLTRKLRKAGESATKVLLAQG
ncbi:hypothetical protein [Calothrix sp. PCC 7507]|uniref:hypothetical protein n=1 Tax=Calothrix sp. PCC 7507 TaxID=99598 RepID=UPI00029EF4EF|nr:hypothetical protein [Calothrix sp. PCC 7507]AFY36063.1 hypothetical protein Cal7507_5742 [Calothrix sp. PCC 7507]